MRLPTSDDAVLAQLECDGLLRVEGERRRTTRRWQAAMSRAAWTLLCAGDDGCDGDLRAPIALALIELYGESIDDDDLARVTELLVPIEARELGLRVPSSSASSSQAR
jgi:hypothetical protein